MHLSLHPLEAVRTRVADESGFTLIELLVVVLIIGVLAAIALPSFLGQRVRAQDAAAKSAVRNAVSQVESCLASVPLAAATCGLANAPVAQAIDSAAPGGTASVTDVDSYVLTAFSRSGNSYTIAKVAGATSRSCTSSGDVDGGCDGTSW